MARLSYRDSLRKARARMAEGRIYPARRAMNDRPLDFKRGSSREFEVLGQGDRILGRAFTGGGGGRYYDAADAQARAQNVMDYAVNRANRAGNTSTMNDIRRRAVAQAAGVQGRAEAYMRGVNGVSARNANAGSSGSVNRLRDYVEGLGAKSTGRAGG